MNRIKIEKEANKIQERYRATAPICTNPGKKESSTTVYKLVEKLLAEEAKRNQ